MMYPETNDRPVDVREAITVPASNTGEPNLLALSLASVQTVDESRIRAATAAVAPMRPQMLLTLLTYCYVKGHYDSRDIVAMIPGDRTLRYICAGARPLWTDLRRFRRYHREMVEQCVAWVFKQARALGNGSEQEFFRLAELTDDELVAEVGTRLGTAALMDGADSD